MGKGPEKRRADKDKKIIAAIENKVTVCLAKAIDEALTDRIGENWFESFEADDAKQLPKNRIVSHGKKSVGEFDFQALLKTLRYREDYSSVVLDYFGYYDDVAEADRDYVKLEFKRLLDRLIKLYRNRYSAHSSANLILKSNINIGAKRPYGLKEIIRDMCELLEIFKDITDDDGKSFYSQAVALATRRTRWRAVIATVVAILAIVLAIGIPHVYENSPHIKDGRATIQYLDMYYVGEEIYVDCYLNNGRDQTVQMVYVTRLIIGTAGGEIIADTPLEPETVEVEPGGYNVITLKVKKESVKVLDADLSDAACVIKHEIN